MTKNELELIDEMENMEILVENDFDHPITNEGADGNPKKSPKKAPSKKEQKIDTSDEDMSEINIPETIQAMSVVSTPVVPAPIFPAELKKTRNRKKLNTKTIRRIQRFF